MQIDLNCDVGEGVGNDSKLMPYLSSCNVSCGAHAGTEKDIKHTLEFAKQHQVKVGAHPSYPDKKNFGRVVLDISHEDLLKSLIQQLKWFAAKAKEVGVTIHHIKAHGALYNKSAVSETIAEVILEAVESVFGKKKIYAPYNSAIAKLAEQKGFKVLFEVFADRNYNEDLSLVSRKLPNAVLHDEVTIVNHVRNMISGKVITISGTEKKIKADTYCVHGDNDNALKILKALHKNFKIA